VSTVRQLSVLIENEAERVSGVTQILAESGINLRGFSVSDTPDFAVLRLIVDDPDGALEVLSDAGFVVKESDVVCILVPDEPGGFAGVLKIVSDAGVNIEYVYSIVATNVVFNVPDAGKALARLADRPVRLVSQEEIANW
jgi:hypothetical protein